MDRPGPLLRSVPDDDPDSFTVPDGYVTVTEAAERLGIHRDTLRQRVRRQTIDALKIGGQWYVRIDQPQLQPVTAVPDSPPPPATVDPDTSQQPSPDTVPDSFTATSSDLALAQAELRRADDLARILQGHYDQLQEMFRTETERLHELLRAEQETRRREVSELHILLQRAQAAIPLPAGSPQSPAAQPDPPVQPVGPPTEPRPPRRRWWWLWELWRMVRL